MAESYEINLEIQGGEQPALVMETEEGATDGASARNAEAWANGTRNGVPVTEGDPAYHNNSKYYRDSAAAIVAGDIIDDDAGIGDYDLTWSADKLAKGNESKAPVINVSDQTSAAVKTLTDGADGMPMALTVGIEPVQAGSGDPSPSNVRAISGWSAVKISRTGKNLVDESSVTVVTGKYLNFDTGVEESAGGYNYIADYFKVNGGAKYTFGVSKTATSKSRGVFVLFYDKSKNIISNASITLLANTTAAATVAETFTVPADAVYARFTIADYTAGTIALVVGENLDGAGVFAGDEYEISIPSTPGTVYGGSLTVNKDGTGKLVVDRKGKGFSELTWSYDSTNTRFYSDAISGMKRINSARRVGFLCSHFQTISDGRSLDNVPDNSAYFGATTSDRQLYVKCTAYTDATAFAEAFANASIVYPLDSSVEYTLTASQVNALVTSLKGVNNLYADSGDILSVEYSADTKLYVDEHNEAEDTAITSIKGMIADSDDPVATESHAIGDVFICNDQLLRATSAIATGETIAVGTNAEILNLADFINEKDANLQTGITGNASQLATLFKIYPTPEAPLEKFGDDFTASVSYGVTHSKVGNIYYLNGTYSDNTYRNYTLHFGSVKAVSTGSNAPSYDEKYVPFALQAGVRHCLKIHYPKFSSSGSEAKRAVIYLLKANSENAMSWNSVVTVDGLDTDYFFTPSEGDRYGLIVKIRGTTMDMAIETTITASPETT